MGGKINIQKLLLLFIITIVTFLLILKVASICDIVLNHTANESEWIREHPDSTYSCFNMPHLRPAFLLDVVFSWISRDVIDENLENVGVPKLIENEDHIQALRHQLHTVYLPKANLSQFYQCDVEKCVQIFSEQVFYNRISRKIKKII